MMAGCICLAALSHHPQRRGRQAEREFQTDRRTERQSKGKLLSLTLLLHSSPSLVISLQIGDYTCSFTSVDWRGSKTK